MSFRNTFLGFSALIFLLGVVWTGCSDNPEFVTKYDPSNSGGESINGSVTYYFPLYEGYKTVYTIKEGDQQYSVSYTVGRVMHRATGDYVPWYSYSPGRGADTGYFQTNSGELLYYERLGAGPERILVLPLSIGATWNRSTSLSTGDENGGIIIDNGNGDNPIVDSTDYGGYVAKNFPSSGEGTMEVVASESVRLSSGENLFGSIKIVNRNNNGTYNQYWYTPGIGLTKYILNSPNSISENGSRVAEISSYDRR